ncbi:MAG: ABC transporter ATP-binding protein [Armatimonadota bacterium]|nr:ABC transporter ATP-binding protein [Armatimonadota bacterium]MDR7439005.1 ABC transporter ATP-binding protein [Armatimonadota bacterium]MDR7563255.1 ABC transporter ATP-binding protein [Armatimonadota bacterium]MDR7566987.1 ABC transporter ATP-binding protein [Armatimonadota bacterium]MDR7602042.1 ABC transporter ATP-binding protein [Armatimonadota bacterium]
MSRSRFWTALHRHRRRYLLGYAAALGSIGMAQLAPWILKAAVDGIQRGEGRLVAYAVGLGAVALLEAALSYVMRMQILGAALRIETEIRRELFQHLERMDPAFFHRWQTGDLMARAVNDLRAVQRFLGMGLMRAVHTAVMVVLSVAFMLHISTSLTLSTLPILLLIPGLFGILGREIRRRFEEVQAQFGRLSARAQENLSGIRVVKAFAREEAEGERFRQESEALSRANVRLSRIQGLLWPAVGFLLGGAAVLLLWIGGEEVIRGRISLGQLVQFSYYLARLSFPVIATGWVLSLWQQGRASMERLEEVFRIRPAIADPEDPVRLETVRGEIEFRDVWVSYDGRPVLRGIRLRIPAGSTVALVGPTGSGKSTLLNLIPRLLLPTSGQVLLDGVDLRRLPLRTVREAVGLVPQDPFLFSDTLRENIAYGADSGDGKRVVEAAQIAHLVQDVNAFPQGFETVVGEQGVTLSGGQRQRAALARALARNPRILILDDALSSVDAQTEEEILRALRPVLRSRTVLLVSHRISTLRDADRIVVLDGGRIVEQGTHEELLRRGGLFAELCEKQRLRQALETEEP